MNNVYLEFKYTTIEGRTQRRVPIGNRYRKVVTRKGRVKEVEGTNEAKQSRRRMYTGHVFS